RRLGVPFLFEPAEADLQLRLGGRLRRGGRGHLAIGVDGIVVLLLILPGPTDSIAGFMDPRAVAEAVDHVFVRPPAQVPLLQGSMSIPQTQERPIAEAGDVLVRLLVAEDRQILDRFLSIAEIQQAFARTVVGFGLEWAL